MTKEHILSETMRDMAKLFDDHSEGNTPVPPHRVAVLAQSLHLLADLARAMEHEVAVFRLKEAGKLRCKTLEDLANGTMVEALLSADGNIIRPEFGSKK